MKTWHFFDFWRRAAHRRQKSKKMIRKKIRSIRLSENEKRRSNFFSLHEVYVLEE